MKITLSILLLSFAVFSQTIIPDSSYTGKRWLLFGYYKTYTAPIDAIAPYMYFDSTWYEIEPVYHELSTPDLMFSPPLDSCNTFPDWIYSLRGQENKKIFLEGKYDTVCWGHGFQTISIDSIYQDSSTLLRLFDTLNSGGALQYLEARLFISGRLKAAYSRSPNNDTVRSDGIVTGLEINKLLGCLNRNGYWAMDSFVTNPDWKNPVYPRHSNLYCKGKSCDLLLAGDSGSMEAEIMLNQLASLFKAIINKTSTERIASAHVKQPNILFGSRLRVPPNSVATAYDIRGRRIARWNPGRYDLNHAALPSGIWFVRVKGAVNQVMKFVKP